MSWRGSIQRPDWCFCAGATNYSPWPAAPPSARRSRRTRFPGDTMRDPVGKLLLFGATGDLAQRMLLPSLYGLHADGLLPEGLTITGTARSEHDDASYR